MLPVNDVAEVRPGERVVDAGPPGDAALHFIGRIRTPWTNRDDCPRQGRKDGPECRIEVFEPRVAALERIEEFETLEALYWLDRSLRDLVRQNPRHGDQTYGTFALRTPARPNPIATSMVRLVRVDGPVVVVRGLDCIDGTPLLDVKPDRCAFSPKAQSGPPDTAAR